MSTGLHGLQSLSHLNFGLDLFCFTLISEKQLNAEGYTMTFN